VASISAANRAAAWLRWQQSLESKVDDPAEALTARQLEGVVGYVSSALEGRRLHHCSSGRAVHHSDDAMSGKHSVSAAGAVFRLRG
jgi:hypothetical protein